MLIEHPEADGSAAPHLPDQFVGWFAAKGWQPRPHQLELLSHAQSGQSMLLIAPTGAGKTLAGFLPSLTDLAARGKRKPGAARTGLHTLYISPLKALAVDIERNLTTPVLEMGLPISIETRTGDTPQSKRQRQKTHPPDILLTTPEQVALLISDPQADRLFRDLKYVIFVPLIAALLALPRDLSDAVVGPELKSRYKLWLSFVRLAYFLVALFIMAILPSLLS